MVILSGQGGLFLEKGSPSSFLDSCIVCGILVHSHNYVLPSFLGFSQFRRTCALLVLSDLTRLRSRWIEMGHGWKDWVDWCLRVWQLLMTSCAPQLSSMLPLKWMYIGLDAIWLRGTPHNNMQLTLDLDLPKQFYSMSHTHFQMCIEITRHPYRPIRLKNRDVL